MALIKSFRGLNSVTDPMRVGLSWLVRADNIDITRCGTLAKRQGYSLAQAGSVTSAYSTMDFQRMYLVDAGVLRTLDGATLQTGIASAPMHWAEINNQVYFNNGTDSGVILSDNEVVPWRVERPAAPTASALTGTLSPGVWQVRCTFVLADGRETGASEAAEITLVDGQALGISDIPSMPGAVTYVYVSPANSAVFQLAFTTTASAQVWNCSNDALGEDLRTLHADSLPLGCGPIQFWKGRAYAAQVDATNAQSAIWMSEPLGFHLFNLARDYLLVPGAVLMLAPTSEALIIGTDSAIYAYTGDGLQQLADYGVVPGQHWGQDGGRILFWATRGVCAALPFSNLTEAQVSVAPGVRAGGAIVRQGGDVRYVVSLQQGGAAFNRY